MSFLSSALGKKELIGIDFGTTSIKIVDIVRAEKGFTLKNYAILENLAYLERPNEAIQASNLKISEERTASYIGEMLKHIHLGGKKDVIASVPPFLAFSTLIELPVASDSEVRKVMELQAKQYIPLPLSAVTLDWVKVGDRKDGSGATKAQVMLAAIPNDHIQAYEKILKRVGLTLHSVEAEGMGLARALKKQSSETTLVVDIGARSTGLSIIRGGSLYFSGQTDFSGSSLTQTIGKGLSISERRAEDLKRARGISGFGGERELSTLIEPLLDVILSEGKRVIASYESAYQDKVRSVLLAGGGGNLVGLTDYFTKYFSVPTTLADPFSDVEMPAALAPIKQQLGPLLAVSVGLGLKEFST